MNNEFTAMDRSEITMFLERAFVRLEAWFQWFNTTQLGICYNPCVVCLSAGDRFFLSDLCFFSNYHLF